MKIVENVAIWLVRVFRKNIFSKIFSARKERSIAKDTIFGFVVDYDEVNPSQYNPPAAGYLHKPPVIFFEKIFKNKKKIFQYRSKRDAASSTDYNTPAPPEYKKEEEYKQPASEYASPGYSPATNYQNYYNYEKTPNVRENFFLEV